MKIALTSSVLFSLGLLFIVCVQDQRINNLNDNLMTLNKIIEEYHGENKYLEKRVNMYEEVYDTSWDMLNTCYDSSPIVLVDGTLP